MKRLTERDQYSQDCKIQAKNLDYHCVAKDKRGYVTYYGEHIDKLAEYEDLEEQGLLLRLPCKVGDIVYSITRDFISEYTICSIEVYNDGFFFCWKCEKGIYINVRGFTNYQIGKDVFLTKSEAEQKLKEMESE